MPVSVRKARAFVVRALRGADREALADTAALLVSEVVTNALIHARSEMRLRVTTPPEAVRVEVDDRSSASPVLRALHREAATGRGIWLLDELATSWGCRRRHDGKTVWFVLGGAEPI